MSSQGRPRRCAGRGALRPLPAGTEERRFVIKGDGSADRARRRRQRSLWNFTAIPDRAPTIELIKDPERQARGSLRLDYKMDDDYGVVEAHAELRAQGRRRRPTSRARPLFSAPDFALTLPQARTRSGAAQTTRDLTEHPWAGAEVAMTLVARDEAGNEGRSEPHELQLAAAHFRQADRARADRAAPHSGARCRGEAAGADRARRAHHRAGTLHARGRHLSRLALDLFRPRPTPRATTRCATWWRGCGTWRCRSRTAMSRKPSRRCAQAQDALRQALERGASDEEIKKLMDQLRAAMDKFLQALAEEMRKNPQQLARPLDRNTRMLSQQDLKSMLDRLEAARALRQQGRRAPVARAIAVDAGEPADGAAGRARRRRRRRHDVGARRARRHDPQAAAIARQDLQARPGPAARPPARPARPGPAAIGRSAAGPAGA